jgi:hypothetical protein
MVKFNEALIIGGALLAALVLSKGSSILPRTSGISFINPYTSQLSEAQVAAIQKGKSNIETLQSIKESNLGIAQDILDYEQNIANTQIDYLQNELSKTQSFISQQQKIANPPQLKIGNKGVISQDQSYWANQLGGLKKYAEDIIFRNAAGTNLVRGKNVSDSRYIDSQGLRESYEQILSKEKIEKANELVFRQQAEISRLQEEYDTRFGSLSRYG